MCIVNKYANNYVQKVYIVMSCLCDFLKLTIADRPALTVTCLAELLLVREMQTFVCVVLSKKENDLWHARMLHLRGRDERCSV